MNHESTSLDIVLKDNPDRLAREVIASGLGQFNTSQAGPGEWRTLAILVQDEAGLPIGGLWGVTSYGWLFIELLFLPPELRGQGLGAKLVAQAEAEALARGCHGAWLDTFEFQARGFYERLGYVLFGQLDDYPRGSARFFMKKSLSPPPSANAGPE